jgi:DNA-binding MarR family transcriptional regulator
MNSWQAFERLLSERSSSPPNVISVGYLTARGARDVIRSRTLETLAVVDDGDTDALEVLRRAGIAYAVRETGELYAPPLAHSARASDTARRPNERYRNPYAAKASRIPRWLLLHPHDTFRIRELSAEVDVDEGFASRTISGLAAEGLVDVAKDPRDERARSVRLVEPRRLLEEWLTSWRRRPPAQRLSIGTRDVAGTLEAIRNAAPYLPRHAISGLAGASFLDRAVEPADVLVVIERSAAEALKDVLLATPSESGLLRVGLLPDAFPLRLAQDRAGLPIADAVQLWLDTAAAGERARTAAQAVAASMDW